MNFLAARWKAILALVVPLIGGLVALVPDSQTAKVWGVIITALLAGGIVHQVPNKDVSVTTPVGSVDVNLPDLPI